jgi:microcystin synthetase protein McyA
LNYGLLRYLNPNRNDLQQWRTLPEPEVSFLYLGQIDHILPASSLYKLSHEGSGQNRSPRGKRGKLFEIEAFILEGRLHLVWTYSEHLHQRATVEKLAAGCVEALRRFSVHNDAAKMPIYTPSDFPEAELNQQELDELVASLCEPDE